MAISANTYATVAMVQIMVGDIVPNRTFSITTIPTLSQVETILDQTAGEMNRALQAMSYTAPISTSETISFEWAQSINTAGASARILMTFPIEAIALDNPEVGNNRAQNLQRIFDRGILVIEEEKLAAPKTVSKIGRVFGGSQKDSDGNRKLPIFTRADNNTPGLESLTE